MKIQNAKWKRPALVVAALAAGAILSGPVAASEVNLNMTKGEPFTDHHNTDFRSYYLHSARKLQSGPLCRGGYWILWRRN